MSTPVKEARSRIRCTECGRVVRSQKSRELKLCCICDADVNLDKIWARRIKIRDNDILEFMKWKATATTLEKVRAVLKMKVEVK